MNEPTRLDGILEDYHRWAIARQELDVDDDSDEWEDSNHDAAELYHEMAEYLDELHERGIVQ